MRRQFDVSIKERLGDCQSLPPSPLKDNSYFTEEEFMVDGSEDEPPIIPEEDPVDNKGRAVNEQPFLDQLLSAEVLLPQDENLQAGKVIARSKDVDGSIKGTYHENPLLNTLTYDVEYPNG